ncbi:MAG: MgtC/SapB family protein [Patescibacteria group bacterium]
MENFTITNLEIFTRLLLAIILGGALGIERSMAGKTAGMRTYSIVSMGAAMFVIISNIVSLQYVNFSFDPLRMASQVIVGIGFIGAGLIIFREEKISGLTTAAGLWVSAGIGMATGFGLYALAIIATALTLFIFIALWFVEKKIQRSIDKK